MKKYLALFVCVYLTLQISLGISPMDPQQGKPLHWDQAQVEEDLEDPNFPEELEDPPIIPEKPDITIGADPEIIPEIPDPIEPDETEENNTFEPILNLIEGGINDTMALLKYEAFLRVFGRDDIGSGSSSSGASHPVKTTDGKILLNGGYLRNYVEFVQGPTNYPTRNGGVWFAINGAVIVSTPDGPFGSPTYDKIKISSDNGDTWAEESATFSDAKSNLIIIDLFEYGGNFWGIWYDDTGAGPWNAYLYERVSAGNWTFRTSLTASTTFYLPGSYPQYFQVSSLVQGSYYYYNTPSGTYRINLGTYVENLQGSTANVRNFHRVNDNLWYGDTVVGANAEIYKSTNQGVNWSAITQKASPGDEAYAWICGADQKYIYALALTSAFNTVFMYRTADEGTSWEDFLRLPMTGLAYTTPAFFLIDGDFRIFPTNVLNGTSDYLEMVLIWGDHEESIANCEFTEEINYINPSLLTLTSNKFLIQAIPTGVKQQFHDAYPRLDWGTSGTPSATGLSTSGNVTVIGDFDGEYDVVELDDTDGTSHSITYTLPTALVEDRVIIFLGNDDIAGSKRVTLQLQDAVPTVGPHIYLENGNVYYQDNIGSTDTGIDYTATTLVQITIEYDTATDVYDLWINEQKYIGTINFNNATGAIKYITVFTEAADSGYKGYVANLHQEHLTTGQKDAYMLRFQGWRLPTASGAERADFIGIDIELRNIGIDDFFDDQDGNEFFTTFLAKCRDLSTGELEAVTTREYFQEWNERTKLVQGMLTIAQAVECLFRKHPDGQVDLKKTAALDDSGIRYLFGNRDTYGHNVMDVTGTQKVGYNKLIIQCAVDSDGPMSKTYTTGAADFQAPGIERPDIQDSRLMVDFGQTNFDQLSLEKDFVREYAITPQKRINYILPGNTVEGSWDPIAMIDGTYIVKRLRYNITLRAITFFVAQDIGPQPNVSINSRQFVEVPPQLADSASGVPLLDRVSNADCRARLVNFWESADPGNFMRAPGTDKPWVVGSQPRNWDIKKFDGVPVEYAPDANNSVTVLASLGNHNKPADIYDNSASFGTQMRKVYSPVFTTTKYIGFWIRCSNVNNSNYFQIQNGSAAVFTLRIYGNNITAYDRVAATYLTIIPARNDIWYFIVIELDLTNDIGTVFINGRQEAVIDNHGLASQWDRVRFFSSVGQTGYHFYVDSFIIKDSLREALGPWADGNISGRGIVGQLGPLRILIRASNPTVFDYQLAVASGTSGQKRINVVTGVATTMSGAFTVDTNRMSNGLYPPGTRQVFVNITITSTAGGTINFVYLCREGYSNAIHGLIQYAPSAAGYIQANQGIVPVDEDGNVRVVVNSNNGVVTVNIQFLGIGPHG